MLQIDLDIGLQWGDQIDWQSAAYRAVAAAISKTSLRSLAPAITPLSAIASPKVSISISMASNDEVQTLNRQWRGKDRPTNVLSFPMLDQNELAALERSPLVKHGDHDAMAREIMIGDIILAYETCVQEAEEKAIPLHHHVAHLIVHGTLHLIGFDHLDDAQGDAMEALEVKALASLGLPNPYMR